MTTGVFFVSTLALMGTLGWALLETLDRIVAVLTLFGYPAATAFWMLSGVYATAGLLYLANVLSATESAEVHPGYPASGIVSGAASLILPGWGQILNGHRVRAMVFLASMLSLVGFGLTVRIDARELLGQFGLVLPYWESFDGAPTLRWTIPLLLWALAVYDAAASANAQRQARPAPQEARL